MRFLTLEQATKMRTFEEYFDAEWDAFERYMAGGSTTAWYMGSLNHMQR